MVAGETITYEVGPGETISEGVVGAIAAIENVPAIDLPPLRDTIDADALNTLYRSSPEPPTRLEFDYYGYAVVVRDTRRVSVTAHES